MKKNNNPYLVKAILSIIFSFVNMLGGILIFYLTGNSFGAFISGTSIGLAIMGGRWLAMAETINNRNKFIESVNTFNDLMLKAIKETIEEEKNAPFKEFESENRKQ